ncbi:hypothetical protein [Sinomonas sp. P10A9]|uniref:Multisubunit sodium/proton antiporter MrpE subunit n=1 Tax=Sinomonas puerhi TaxID=3238584 RepID=A0AB39L7Q0_9MICC
MTTIMGPGTRRFFGVPGARGAAGALVELTLWTIAGTLFWLATASTISVVEVLIAALAALLGGILARAARRAMPFRARPRRVWLRWAATVPVAAMADMVRLAGWLGGSQPEDLRTASMPQGRGPRETGWRAGGIVSLSATPGSVVVGSDPEVGTVTVHTLVSGWPGLDESVLRPRDEG